MKTWLKFALVGLANVLVWFIGLFLIFLYAKFDFSLELMLVLTFAFYFIVFFAIGYILYRIIRNFDKNRYIWFTVLGGIISFALIFWDGYFGNITNSIGQLVLEWASTRRTIFSGGAIIDFAFRDAVPIAIIGAIMINILFFIAICPIVLLAKKKTPIPWL